MQNPMRKIPVTVVTGFLGSGKTTLLRHILQHAGGKRIAVIVNEFGELGIDGEILKGCGIGCDEQGNETEGQLYELANGCLCCTVQGDLESVVGTLYAKRGSGAVPALYITRDSTRATAGITLRYASASGAM